MRTVVFRPTNNCNLSCSYCYDKNNHFLNENTIMNNATELFRREENNILYSLDKLFEGESNPRIIFHGGEPLLVHSSVLDEFCDKISKNRNIVMSIQTNGTLINEKVIDLFKKYNFKVGISLDGCDER